jgi:hypothetical protein
VNRKRVSARDVTLACLVVTPAAPTWPTRASSRLDPVRPLPQVPSHGRRSSTGSGALEAQPKPHATDPEESDADGCSTSRENAFRSAHPTSQLVEWIEAHLGFAR